MRPLNCIKLLVHSGANVNLKDDHGFFLCISPQAKDDKNMTPLFYAAEYGNTEVIRMLLNYGAAKDVVNSLGEKLCDLLRRN
jgi:ankyrin repeat protein